jgi:hypothetical protein
MEGIIGLVLLGAVVYGIYRMSRKREEVVESEVVAPVVDKATEDIKVDYNAKAEEAFVKAMVEEATKVNKPVEEVLKEVVATVEPVAVVEEPVVAPAPAPVKQKRTRKKKAK